LNFDTQNNPGAQKVKEECTSTDCGLYKQGVSKQRRTNVLLGVTGGLAVFTVVAAALTDWGSDAPSAEARSKATDRGSLDVEPWLMIGQGAMVGAQARF
jgi:hypothetical protein